MTSHGDNITISNNNGLRIRIPIISKPRMSHNTKRAANVTATTVAVEPKPVAQRVFLYMQLKNISNMPVVSYPMELHLYHAKNTLQKMSEHYTTETIIYQDEFNMERPAFAMGIFQDNIDDLNMFSDNPLVVTLYQRIPRHRKCDLKTVAKVRTRASRRLMVLDLTMEKELNGDPASEETTADEGHTKKETSGDAYVHSGEDCEEDDDYIEEGLEFISRGHCDLLQLFQSKRFISSIPIMMYPEYDHMLQTSTTQKITTTSEWDMYSILPLLKKLHFTNLVFITLESIYNASEDLHNRAAHLGMSLYIRATKPTLNGEHRLLPLCTFYGFGSQVINEQNIIIVWENIKRDLLGKEPLGIANVQMETNLHIKLHHLFRQLLMTQGVNFKLDEINPLVDSALINNSLHRYVITREMREILEAAIVHSDYELILQLYDDVPNNVLYEGVIDPSIFGYPDVNMCRFASVLTPVTKRATRKTYRFTETKALDKPMFAIVQFCFFQPLTQRNEPLDAFNENHLKSARLRRCMAVENINGDKNASHIREVLYRNFDEHIKELISFIIKNEVGSVEDKRSYFCCNLGNLRNLLVNICGADFNVRTPTKTNIEFREMLTHMHAELMERIYRLLKDCSWESLSRCMLNVDSDRVKMRRQLEEYRIMCIVGECDLAKQLFNELRSGCTNKLLLHFYVFLNAIENLNFEQASQYLAHGREYDWQGAFFVDLMELYITYQLQLRTEQSQGEAFSDLIEQLRIFAKKNRLDQEAWILMYCFYKRCNYMPGMEFTRWTYESLYEVPSRGLPPLPLSLFETFLPESYDLAEQSIKTVSFYKVFKKFARLGAYGFADVVFQEISEHFTPVERYLVNTTLQMLQGSIDKKFQVRTITTDKTERGVMMRYYQAHINGNAEYSRRRYDEAIKYFKVLLTINKTDEQTMSHFYISLVRLARLAIERGDYELAMQAFEMCAPTEKSKKNFLANYGMGVALYYLNRFEEAIEYLARSTEVDVFMPDPWGYLAIINLRLDRNKTALDCWKIAKMYPEITLNNRIYDELEKIKYSDVCLLVEDNCKPI